MDTADTLEDTFRREAGKLVASLGRAFGFQNLELIEDAVQEAMIAALATWGRGGMPDKPGAWLLRVARNRLVDELRRRGSVGPSDAEPAGSAGELPPLRDDIRDEQLRMLFVCCDQTLPIESRLVLALKLLCGFETREIARRLFTSEANVQKRLERGRERLKQLVRPLDLPQLGVLQIRVGSVRQVLYLLFNEGYQGAQPDQVIRRELCEEALYLGHMLAEHPAGDGPETWALLALMYFHTARLDSRTDQAGRLVLLEEQDRGRWDRALIAQGFACLHHSGRGEVFSRYHAEAAIAAEHCVAPSFAETRWQEVIDLYEILERFEPSPVTTLNRAIAVAQLRGPQAGLDVLRALRPPGWLLGYYLWDAVLGELERQAGNLERARLHLERALAGAPSRPEKALIERRLALCAT